MGSKLEGVLMKRLLFLHFLIGQITAFLIDHDCVPCSILKPNISIEFPNFDGSCVDSGDLLFVWPHSNDPRKYCPLPLIISPDFDLENNSGIVTAKKKLCFWKNSLPLSFKFECNGFFQQSEVNLVLIVSFFKIFFN